MPALCTACNTAGNNDYKCGKSGQMQMQTNYSAADKQAAVDGTCWQSVNFVVVAVVSLVLYLIHRCVLQFKNSAIYL